MPAAADAAPADATAAGAANSAATSKEGKDKKEKPKSKTAQQVRNDACWYYLGHTVVSFSWILSLDGLVLPCEAAGCLRSRSRETPPGQLSSYPLVAEPSEVQTNLRPMRNCTGSLGAC